MPWRLRCRNHLFYAHVIYALTENRSIDPVPISQQIIWRRVPWRFQMANCWRSARFSKTRSESFWDLKSDFWGNSLKMRLDNQIRFWKLNANSSRSFYFSICWAAAESGTQFIIFAYSALKRRVLSSDRGIWGGEGSPHSGGAVLISEGVGHQLQ